MQLETLIKNEARRLGFQLAGIAAATTADTFPHYEEWLAQDRAGEMGYMIRHAEARRDPTSILEQVRTVVMVGMNYHLPAPERPPEPGEGRIASYAQGQDYHDLMRSRLNDLLAWVRERVPEVQGRGVVDTAPLLERDFARRAGLGWFGKNTMLLDKRLGSFFFLGALLLDLLLRPDAPHSASHCGTCTACLDACPTGAFPAPYQLDARKCISYLTIELKGPIPDPLRHQIGDWVFGCDICQDVCPWNRKAPMGAEPDLQPAPGYEPVDLVELLSLTEEQFRERFRGTAILRAKRRGLLRNAAIALGNTGNERAIPALERACSDREPLIREAAEWALARIRERMRL